MVSPGGATVPTLTLDLGGRLYDLTHRALVMGILNRTPDSFYDKGATYGLDDLLVRAEQIVKDGADILDVGGVKAGPGPRWATGGAGPRGPAIAALSRAFRSTRVGRHLACLGGPGGVRGRCGHRQRHQRVRRPRLPGRRRRRRGRCGCHPYPPGPAGARPRARATRT